MEFGDSLRYYNRDQGGLSDNQSMFGFGGQRQVPQQLQGSQMGVARGQSSDFSLLSGNAPKPSQPNQGFSQGSIHGTGLYLPNRPSSTNPGPLDNSNFPSLGGAGSLGGAPASASLGGRTAPSGNVFGGNNMYSGAVIGGGTNHNRTDENFAIENEDFPALPGAKANAAVGSTVSSAATSSTGLMGRDLGSFGHSTAVNAALSAANSLAPGPSTGAASSPAAATANSNPEVKYGLGGLLDLIRLTDKDLSSLVLGTDLTTIGLNLNAADSLFPTFSSPFSDQALTPDPQFRTPSCYLMHPPSLKSEHLQKFQLETLFYIFYSMPRDILQACAAQELYRREWRFHSESKLWLKARNPMELMQSHPSVMFVFFDVASWEARLFTAARGPNVVNGLLTEEDVRVKVPPQAPPAS